MDTEPEELQFLGLFGIYREAYKIVVSWRKIFTQISLSLVLPLCFIILAHAQISDLLFSNIKTHEAAMNKALGRSSARDKLRDRLSAEWTTFVLFKAFYLVIVLIFSLLSTSAVVYTIACIYTAKDITYRRVMSVVPKVWKRLIVTFLWNFIVMVGYNAMAALFILLSLTIVGTHLLGSALTVILFASYLTGLVYISVVWHLASVVSVLEDMYGLRAMQKSIALIRGKLLIACLIFLTLNLALMSIHVIFEKLVVRGGSEGTPTRIAAGIAFFLLLSAVILIGLVIQTVIYFVCKSYHHESIDKSSLSDHLEAFGEYVPLKDSSVQLEQFYP